MNRYQELCWQQAKSDHELFLWMRERGLAQCQALHYLQMVTEKMAKAYFWRNGSPPPKSHVGFVQFLRFLGQTRQADRDRIANLFAFARFDDFQTWIRAVLPIAYALERLTLDLAQDGPNTEYPWPHGQPQFAPVGHDFDVWKQWLAGQGRHLMRFIRIAVEHFSEFADL